MAAHQGVVRTAALIKRRFYWPRMQNDAEAWCKRCKTCGCCKAAVRGHGELQQPRHGAFNERVSVDLIGPLHRTDRGNEYILVMQDHFTKWIESAAVATKGIGERNSPRLCIVAYVTSYGSTRRTARRIILSPTELWKGATALYYPC